MRSLTQASLTFFTDPRGAVERARDVLDDRRERGRRPYPYDGVPDWHRRMHELFGLPWPCARASEAHHLWSALVGEMRTRGIALGRASFGGWDDGGPALALASYCLVRHLRPQHVVETGVAHGVTTRFVLEALERNGFGALWSIDLQPLLATELHEEIAVAVPLDLRGRWTLCLGSSRRRLAPLLEELGSIGLFVHDSLHTERNLRYELERAWGALAPGGGAIVDDVDYNPGLRMFVEQAEDARSLVAPHDDRRRLFGVIRKDAPVLEAAAGPV